MPCWQVHDDYPFSWPGYLSLTIPFIVHHANPHITTGDLTTTSITIHDGAESIGGNKIHVEHNGRGLFLDFGTNFGRTQQFYSDFLQNRSSRGINDALLLNIIPKLDIYRQDLVPADVRPDTFVKCPVEAVLLSHAHVDHCGAIGYLKESIPIVASATSIAILKGMQDTTLVSTDIAYVARKKRADGDGRMLKSVDTDAGRAFYATTEPSRELRDFLAAGKPRAKGSKKSMVPGLLGYYKNLSLPFEVKTFDVDHSIFGATAYLLSGETAIAYTGDFRLHGKAGESSKKFIAAAKEASVLITEGTRVGRKGETENDDTVSEDQVKETCRAAVEGAGKDLVIADFGPRNFERLEIFKEIARKTGRKLVVTAKDAYMFHALGCTENACSMENTFIYDELKDKRNIKWETEVVMDEYGKRYVSNNAVSEAPEQFILCFSTYDLKHLLDIRPEKGTYIYSACESFSESMDLDFIQLWHWLTHFRFDVYGFAVKEEMDRDVVSFDKHFHASGHASENDLAWAIDTIDPDIIVPVHTEGHEWFLENWDKVKIIRDGDTITL